MNLKLTKLILALALLFGAAPALHSQTQPLTTAACVASAITVTNLNV